MFRNNNYWNKEDSLKERQMYDPIYIREAEEYKKKQEKDKIELEHQKALEKQKHTVILTFKNKIFKNNSIKKYFIKI